jgi:hypothetical protein
MSEQHLLPKRPAFPHPGNALWIPVLLLVGWGPLMVADVLYPHDWKVAENFGMAWGMAVAVPGALLALLSGIFQVLQFLADLWARPKPPK